MPVQALNFREDSNRGTDPNYVWAWRLLEELT